MIRLRKTNAVTTHNATKIEPQMLKARHMASARNESVITEFDTALRGPD